MDWTTLGTTLGSVLVSNFFVAFVSLRTARWQINSAKKQLDRQIQNERDRDQTQRRREIRGEPLKKLSFEIARMSSKLELMRLTVEAGADGSQQSNKWITTAEADLSSYFAGGEWLQASYMIDDVKLIDKVETVFGDYVKSLNVLYNVMAGNKVKPEEVDTAKACDRRNKPAIAGVQSLSDLKNCNLLYPMLKIKTNQILAAYAWPVYCAPR